MKYSQELVERYKKYMSEKHGHVASDEEAQLHLNSFANLWEAFAGLYENKKEKWNM